jgi:hypothetical protein
MKKFTMGLMLLISFVGVANAVVYAPFSGSTLPNPIPSPTMSAATFLGTTTFPGSSSIDASGNAIFGGTLSSGPISLANSDAIYWRNFADSANIPLTVDDGNYLTYNGVEIFNSAGRMGANAVPAFTGGDVTSAGSSLVLSIGAGKVTNSMLAGSIASSKLVGSDIATLGTVTSGTWNSTKIGIAYGGTNADLSATGGTSQVLKQTTLGGNVSVARLACSDLSNASASCSTDTTVATNITSGTLGSTVQGNITTVGTVTSGTWNAGAVTSSGAITSNSVAQSSTVASNAISTTGGIGAAKSITTNGDLKIGGSGSTNAGATVINSAGATAQTAVSGSGTAATFGNISAWNGMILLSNQGDGTFALILMTLGTPTLTVISEGNVAVGTNYGTGSAACGKNYCVWVNAGVLTVTNTSGTTRTFIATIIRAG